MRSTKRRAEAKAEAKADDQVADAATAPKDGDHDDQDGDQEGTEEGAEDDEDDDEEDGEEKTEKTARTIRTVKAGDAVTLRRAGPCRVILSDPANVKKIDSDQVATLEILEGRSKGQIETRVKRYNPANAIGPTDQVLPSWIADDFEVG